MKLVHIGQDHQDNLVISEKQALYYHVEGATTFLHLHLDVKAQAECTLFIHCQTNQPLHLQLDGQIEEFAQVKIGLLDLEAQSTKWDTNLTLAGAYAQVDVISAQLCHPHTEKVGAMEINHQAGYTNGQMKHFSVLLDDARYEMVANGHILANCPQASSHQATRALTLGKGHDIKVIPLLLIDENRVQASHALTIGQPDADQLYYLQSRGLSHQQALGLLSIGYVLPVLDLIDDDDLKQDLVAQAEQKVGLYAR